jgi:hypothetical protein
LSMARRNDDLVPVQRAGRAASQTGSGVLGVQVSA